MTYQTVFDAATAHEDWTSALSGFIPLAGGLYLLVNRRKLLAWSRRSLAATTAYGVFVVLFSILWIIGAMASSRADRRAIDDPRRARVVEGVVTDFRPMPWSGHGMERFCVQGRCFEYSDYVVTAGFNNTSTNGGPIREGLAVRVTYVDDEITKLEIAR
jgi:hypothetical protein